MKYPLIAAMALLALSCRVKETERQNVFRYNESKGIATLDPAFARSQALIWPVIQLYNGLVQLDEHLEITPCIAHKWEVSQDGRTYTFHIRDDVYFHDHPVFEDGKGRKVVATDFVFSLNRITDPAVASPGAWIFHLLDKGRGTNYTGLEAPDDTTLRIYLSEPFPAFTSLLTEPYCFVVPREAVDHYGRDFRSHPVGTGPFRMAIWREDEKLVLTRNMNYFEKDSLGRPLPYLDAVSISFIKDKQSEFMEFMLGNLDFLSGVHPAYKDELMTRYGKLNPAYEGRIRMLSEPYLNTEYLGILVDTSLELVKGSPLLDRRVRQAINFGFDRAKMMKYLRNGIGTPAFNGFVPDGIPGYDTSVVTGYSYDPDRARELLIRAGYPGGEGLPPVTLTTTSDYLDLCEYIQHELMDIGMDIRINVSTGAAFRNMVANSGLEFFRGSWIADYPDAENYLALFYSRNFSPSGPNYTHYSNPQYDRLYERAMRTLTDEERYPIYYGMDQLITDESVIIPLYYDQVVRFIPVGLEGLGTNPMNLLILKRARWIDLD
jgi:oligopeptide transport system substrate-binding protein